MNITTEDLKKLLAVKLTKQAVYSQAHGLSRKASDHDVIIQLDMAEQRALKASVAADRAYEDALKEYMKQQDAA